MSAARMRSYRFGLLADDQPTDASDRLASLITDAARWLDGFGRVAW